MEKKGKGSKLLSSSYKIVVRGGVVKKSAGRGEGCRDGSGTNGQASTESFEGRCTVNKSALFLLFPILVFFPHGPLFFDLFYTPDISAPSEVQGTHHVNSLFPMSSECGTDNRNSWSNSLETNKTSHV